MCSSTEYEGFSETWTRRDRRDRLCSECGFVIRAGTKHTVSLFVRTDGDHYPQEELEEIPETSFVHEHRECHRLAEDAAEIVCRTGVVPVGELEEHVAIAEAALAGVDVVEEYGDEYENIDREKLPALLARWHAIEAKYGGERELGGEG